MRKASLGNPPELMSIGQAVRLIQRPDKGGPYALMASGRAKDVLALQYCNLRFVPMVSFPFVMRG